MAFINQGLVDGAALLARQATPTTLLAVISPTPTPTPTLSSSVTSSSTASLPSDTSGGGSGGGGGGGGGTSQSSPLLFFVALGFGVVFTNLWIIVGVKYCFRYNARSRRMRLAEDGEPITLENIPRPHRRRREKKLMTMDEVNEKFPMLKYKNWVVSRAQEGLPTRGGVSAPPSGANSVRSVEGVVPELPPKERDSTEERITTSATSREKREVNHEPEDSTSGTVLDATHPSTEGQTSAPVPPPEAVVAPREFPMADEHEHTDEEDDDEHINAALPPACVGTSGDTCAICIDTLEDDDDVRGLTCGHAFHAVCVDPWLTSRRACCPLCKADYYTPKPRPPGAEAGEGGPTQVIAVIADGRNRMNLPPRPPATWMSIRGTGRVFPPARFVITTSDSVVDRPAPANSGSSRRIGLFGRSRPAATPPNQAPSTERSATPADGAGGSGSGNRWFGTIRTGLPPFRLPHTRRPAQTPQGQTGERVASGADPVVSPSLLEAGVRNETQ